MSELISGKEALIAVANGETIQTKVKHSNTWVDFDTKDENTPVTLFLSGVNRNGFDFDFRRKPRTITLNGIEVPAPFKPKDGEKCFILDVGQDDGFYGFTFHEDASTHKKYISLGAWRTEEEIKQVVEALRSIFK